MTKSSKKWYVVRVGKQTGICDTRDECKKRVHWYSWAKYQSFSTSFEAQKAYDYGYWAPKQIIQSKNLSPDIIIPSISVDASCLANPWIMEYQWVRTQTGERLFHWWPIQLGTNNVWEFIALVDAMRWMKINTVNYPIYSDSRTAIRWVYQKKCNTTLCDVWVIHQCITSATNRLQTNDCTKYVIYKRETKKRWEIPADFGRK
jgi:ribonuclease HI